MSEFGKALKLILDEKKVEQIDLATATGIHKGTISRITTGRQNAGPRSKTKICSYLGLTESQVLNRLAPHPGETPAIVGEESLIGSINTMLTEKRTLASELEQHKAILNAIGDGIAIVDMDYRYTYQNDTHRHQTGGNHLGEQCFKALFGKDAGVCEDCPTQKTMKDGAVHKGSKLIPLTGHQLNVVASPLRNAAGEMIGVIQCMRDIGQLSTVTNSDHPRRRSTDE